MPTFEAWFASEGTPDPICADFDELASVRLRAHGDVGADAEVCLAKCNQASCS